MGSSNNDETSSSSSSGSASSGSASSDNNNATQQKQQAAKEKQRRISALEAKAVAEATATADAAWVPSTSAMNSSSVEPLLKQIDGPSLKDYQGKESVYVGRSVPIAAGGALEIPIQVASPGSVVEYAVENKAYDFDFGIVAERDEGITIVKETARVEATDGNAITGKFLVGSVPCLVRFNFANDFSWVREKVISYKVTVTPPSTDTLGAGRRRRAKAGLKAVRDDLKNVTSRQVAAKDQLTVLETELEQLMLEVEQKKKSLQAVKDEEKWCDARVALRQEEAALLIERLEKGWEDEQ
mmetsp:Transcript_419/g.1075  ORF Transcript_419/g.1075 Transcript_419/m.1075 type:complete len:298 (-) Transcript_419:613-1506(-)